MKSLETTNPTNITYITLWDSRVSRDERGKIQINADNAAIILHYDPRWSNVFGYNLFERRKFVREPLPKAYPDDRSQENWKGARPLSDTDVNHTRLWLQRNTTMWSLNEADTYAAITRVAAQQEFHPIHDELAELAPWDGVPRLDTWLSNTFGVEDAPFNAIAGRKFFLGLVARILSPGCKMDYMLVLEGDQGLRKSQACQVLCGGKGYGVAQFKSLESSDTSQFLKNKWLVEFGEMHVLRKSEVNELKLWLVKEIEDYRAKYGREHLNEPRQCVFIGTSNNSEWLNDPTGGRRFWPVLCKKVDIEWLEANRPQMLAEAIVAHKAGELPFPDPELEKQYFLPVQASRMVEDPWENELVPLMLKLREISVSNIYTRLGITKGQVDIVRASRVKNIMMKYKWEKVRKNGGIFYRCPAEWPPKG